jgi:hypothetical protein
MLTNGALTCDPEKKMLKMKANRPGRWSIREGVPWRVFVNSLAGSKVFARVCHVSMLLLLTRFNAKGPREQNVAASHRWG